MNHYHADRIDELADVSQYSCYNQCTYIGIYTNVDI